MICDGDQFRLRKMDFGVYGVLLLPQGVSRDEGSQCHLPGGAALTWPTRMYGVLPHPQGEGRGEGGQCRLPRGGGGYGAGGG
ncbi:hypothetical protein CHU32_27205 [Superficieibacter electus]|uniref:Uncharacterized protein n=1 Tax=Superficieibacter electus TaxID=2022662 RepID=A0A2P5GGU7_9ENTR|nr:hypothetical protein CHU32_27205 [Superficieibacter electus]